MPHSPNASHEALPAGESPLGFSPALPLPLSDNALAAADELYPLGSDTLGAVTSLRSRGFSPEDSSAIISLAQARSRARTKFGERARTLMLTQEASEQATRPVIAHYRADRLARVPGLVADLGCGIGSDTAVYAAARGSVVAVELDPLTASFAAANLAFCPRARVYSGDVTAYDPASGAGSEATLTDGAGASPAILWLDPARRELRGARKAQTERLFDPEAFSPPFSFVLNLARTGMPMGVKLGPGFPHEGIPSPEDIASEANPAPRIEAEWIQSEGSLAELVLWFNALAQEGVARTATSVRELPAGPADRVPSVAEATGKVADLLPPYEAVSFRSALTAAEAERSVEVPVSLLQPGEYLLEPAPAIVRSHLVAEFAQSIGAQLLDEHLAYLCSTEPVEHPLVTCYEVLEEIPLQEKQLKRWVREQGFTALTIKKRGVDIVPEQLRARLLGSAGSKPSKKKQKKNANSSGGAQESLYRPATLVFTRIGAGRDSRRVGWHVRPL
jgi:SAM-dependent methyltransferase